MNRSARTHACEPILRRALLVLVFGACCALWRSSVFVAPLIRPLNNLLGASRARVIRRVNDLPVEWRPGPAWLKTDNAKRVMVLLKGDPMLLMTDATVKEELALLMAEIQREKKARELRGKWSPPGAIGEAADMVALSKRIAEVKAINRVRLAAELMYVMVCSRFKHLDVPLIPPMIQGGLVRFSERNDQLRGLTEIYSFEALEIVRDHLYSLMNIDPENPPGKDGQKRPGNMLIALYQVGQVYGMSALFGYYLRRTDARYQLEKLTGSLGKIHEISEGASTSLEGRLRSAIVPRWMQPEWVKGDSRAERSIKDYINDFGPEELSRIRSLASTESQLVMESQLLGLFGNLRLLKKRLLAVTAGARTKEEASQKVQQAMEKQEVQSIDISPSDFRRLVLEAVFFGSALYDAELEASKVYDMTPASEPFVPYH